jgi:hypothetical protein
MLTLRDTIPITDELFDKDPRYGHSDIQMRYKFRADRLRLMPARAISYLRSFGQANIWTEAEIGQQLREFVTEFYTTIAPTNGGSCIPLEATLDAVVLGQIGTWIPDGVEDTTELPEILHSTIFKQFSLLLTMFNGQRKPLPPPLKLQNLPSTAFAFTATASAATSASLKYLPKQINDIGALAQAITGLQFPSNEVSVSVHSDDRRDFWFVRGGGDNLARGVGIRMDYGLSVP